MGRKGWLWKLHPAFSRSSPLLQSRNAAAGGARYAKTRRKSAARCGQNAEPSHPQPPSWVRAEELPVPARLAPRRHLAAGQLGRGAAVAAGTWRSSRPSPGPPSPGCPSPAAPRAPREVKSWENRLSLNSSPGALGTHRRPRSGRRACPCFAPPWSGGGADARPGPIGP